MKKTGQISEFPRPAESDFERFWAAYPKKVAKLRARAAWAKHRPPLDMCLEALSWQRQTEQWQNGYVPHPATWINGGQWEDEPPEDLTKQVKPLFQNRPKGG